MKTILLALLCGPCAAQVPVNIEVHCANCHSKLIIGPPDSTEYAIDIPSPLQGPWLTTPLLAPGTSITLEAESNGSSAELDWLELRVMCLDPQHALQIMVDGRTKAKLLTTLP